jgi:uncharacterized small protein (DUF1192 family)
MFHEDDAKQKPKAFLLGQDVSAFSIADLDDTVTRLRDEILRLESEKARKLKSAAAADALFRKA